MPVTNHAAPAARRAFAGRQLGNSSARVARKTKPHGRTKDKRNKPFVGHFLGYVLFSGTTKTLSCRDKTKKNASEQEQTSKGNKKHSKQTACPPQALEGLTHHQTNADCLHDFDLLGPMLFHPGDRDKRLQQYMS